MNSGERRGLMRLEPFTAEWLENFTAESAILRAAVGPYIQFIEHIGSTAIHAIASKPIIDMVAGVASVEDSRSLIPVLQALGYHLSEKDSTSERLFFRKGNPTRFQLSLAQAEGWFVKRNLLFRNYLNRHPEEAESYRALKETLADVDPEFGRTYTDGKSEFVRRILDLAQRNS